MTRQTKSKSKCPKKFVKKVKYLEFDSEQIIITTIAILVLMVSTLQLLSMWELGIVKEATSPSAEVASFGLVFLTSIEWGFALVVAGIAITAKIVSREVTWEAVE